MKYFKKFITLSIPLEIRWQTWLLPVLSILFLAGCDNSSSSGGPLGPSGTVTSAALIKVTPATVTLAKGDQLTFTAAGGTNTFTWSVNNPIIASVNSTTGAFTAGSTVGTVTVTATDANGATGTATVTISLKTLTIVPATSKVGKGGAQTFLVTGATVPVFWSVNNTTLGSIDVGTGVFTAGITAGVAIITVLDADGDTATATVEIIANVIIVTPASISFSSVPLTSPTFLAAGGTNTFTFLLTGATNSFSGAAISTTVLPTDTTVTIDITAMPTGDTIGPPLVTGEGNQTLTVTATDSNGDFGTAQITLIAPEPQ